MFKQLSSMSLATPCSHWVSPSPVPSSGITLIGIFSTQSSPSSSPFSSSGPRRSWCGKLPTSSWKGSQTTSTVLKYARTSARYPVCWPCVTSTSGPSASTNPRSPATSSSTRIAKTGCWRRREKSAFRTTTFPTPPLWWSLRRTCTWSRSVSSCSSSSSSGSSSGGSGNSSGGNGVVLVSTWYMYFNYQHSLAKKISPYQNLVHVQCLTCSGLRSGSNVLQRVYYQNSIL